MKYLDFEKHIKKELEGSRETVQMDALLTSLNLGQKTKRAGFAYWKIAPFLILTLSVFAWKFMDGYENKNDGFHTEKASAAVSSEEGVYNSKASAENDNSTSEVETNVTLDTKNDHSESINTNNINSTNTTSNLNDIPTKNQGSEINKTPPANNTFPINNNKKSNQLHLNEASETINLNTSYVHPAKTSASSSPNINSTASATSAKISRNIENVSSLYKSIDALENENIDGKLFSRMKINCPSFDNVGWHMALIPEIGVFLPRKTLTKNDFEESAAFDERINSESTLEGIELGLYGMLVRDNIPLYLKAGVSYSRITERMDLKYEYIQLDTVVDIVSSTVSANGDTITHIYGDVVKETKFKGSNRQHHYIHLFDVPISVGYTTYIGGLDIGIEGGVKVNFMTRATGNLLTSQKDYTNLSLNRMFKNRIGLSYFGGLMIGRNFGRFGDFYIAPRFTYFPNEFNNQNNPIDQKYFNIGLNAGVVYKIN